MSILLPSRRFMLQPPGRRLLYPGHVQDYLDRVIAADRAAGDTSGLEIGVTDALSACIQSLVDDGILGISGGVLAQAASLVKAGAPMMGARTLSGSLTQWAATMPAPTNFNFVSGDYNRKTGVIGNASTKYLDTNRNHSLDPQDNNHMAVFVTQVASSQGVFIGATGLSAVSGTSVMIGGTSMNLFTRCRTSTASTDTVTPRVGLVGMARSAAGSYTVRRNQANVTVSVTSIGNQSAQVLVFRRGDTVAPLYADHRLALYSVGESLDMAVLENRTTALSNALDAAIP